MQAVHTIAECKRAGMHTLLCEACARHRLGTENCDGDWLRTLVRRDGAQWILVFTINRLALSKTMYHKTGHSALSYRNFYNKISMQCCHPMANKANGQVIVTAVPLKQG